MIQFTYDSIDIEMIRLTLSLAFLLIITTAVQAEGSFVHQSLSEASNVLSSNAYAFKKCRALQNKPFDKNSRKKTAIIIGDSQGCDFLNSVLENGYLKNFLTSLYIHPDFVGSSFTSSTFVEVIK